MGIFGIDVPLEYLNKFMLQPMVSHVVSFMLIGWLLSLLSLLGQLLKASWIRSLFPSLSLKTIAFALNATSGMC